MDIYTSILYAYHPTHGSIPWEYFGMLNIHPAIATLIKITWSSDLYTILC